MKLHLSHRFACSAEQMIALMGTAEFSQRLSRASNVQQTVLSEETRDGKQHRSLRCVPDRELPLLLQKALGSKQLVYVQDTVLDPITQTVQWSIHPQGTGKRVQISGLTTLKNCDSGCERVIQGEVSINVRWIGGQIEKIVVADVTRSFEKAAVVLSDWVQSKHA